MLQNQKFDNPSSDIETISIDDAGRPAKPKWWQLHHHWHHFSRRTKIIALFIVLLIVTGVGFGLVAKHAVAPGGGAAQANKKTVPSPLTGIEVRPDLAKRPVTGIMIENSVFARPQSGLNDAGVVFEAIAEGGITRFLALFQEAQPQYIGPVRSVRPYYIDWANGFDASVAHVGGSPKALRQIRSGGKDLDQFFNAGAYWRIASRPSPHDVYTSFKKLDQLNRSKGYKKSVFTGWLRKADAPLPTPKAKAINLAISGPDFNVAYTYGSKDNNYKRFEGGRAHGSTSSASPKSIKVIRPKVVIAMVVGFSLDSDGHHSDYRTIGSGPVFIFQDGNVIKGTWQKKARDRQIKFLDGLKHQIALDAGQTWVTVVDSKSAVRYHR